MYRLLTMLATLIYRKLSPHILHSAISRRVAVNLIRLNPGKAEKQLLDEYYIRKIALCLSVLAVGILLGGFAFVSAWSGRVMKQNGLLYRGECGGETREITVVANSNGVKVRLPVAIKARKLTKSEADKMLETLAAALPKLILGSNVDLQNVKKDLLLREEYEGYPAMVEWKTNCPDVLTDSGEIKKSKGPTMVVLTATLRYEECVRKCDLVVVVHPPVWSQEEQLRRELEDVLSITDWETSTQTEWQLPVSQDGEEIRWQQIVTNNGPLIWLGTLGVSILLYFCSDRDLEEKVQKRRKKLRHEYPEIVHKLVLFSEAGMTVRGAFQRIAKDYEEIAYSCNELNAGRSEAGVYERMGKRVALQEYIRLGTLLSQNIRWGNKTLMARLRVEADKASEEQLQRARKAGEQAGTKLLVPMVLQLAVVMVMIMVPVFLDM